MNNLFNSGDYVLLSDCKAFDEKYGLEEDATMWAVARKMEGGEPLALCMTKYPLDTCVGIRSTANVGCWEGLTYLEYSTQLTVEDVLYRSEDGLTLTELSEIAGAFDEGKEYECVSTDQGFTDYTLYPTYKTNGKGVVYVFDEGSLVSICEGGGGTVSRFKPVTTKTEWVPKVGEGAMTSSGKVTIRYIKKSLACVEFSSGTIGVAQLSKLKPIDKDRERIIKKVTDLAETLDYNYTARDFAMSLYNAGFLSGCYKIS